MGRRCEARFQASTARTRTLWQTRWFPGVITAVKNPPGYCSVLYDDGDFEKGVGNLT